MAGRGVGRSFQYRGVALRLATSRLAGKRKCTAIRVERHVRLAGWGRSVPGDPWRSDGQTDGQTGRQTDRQTDTPTLTSSPRLAGQVHTAAQTPSALSRADQGRPGPLQRAYQVQRVWAYGSQWQPASRLEPRPDPPAVQSQSQCGSASTLESTSQRPSSGRFKSRLRSVPISLSFGLLCRLQGEMV